MLLYFFILRIASLWNEKARKLVKGQAETLSLLKQSEIQNHSDATTVWIHAASVGEAEQARPVIEQLRKKQTDSAAPLHIVMTFFSPSGYEAWKGKEQEKGVDEVLYLPFASRRNAKRWVCAVQPQMALFIKYEYWRPYLRELHKKGIPTYSVASVFRRWQAFFKPLTGRRYRSLLRYFTKILVQDDASRQLLEQYGITNTAVVGDPRFNRVLEIADEAFAEPMIEQFVTGAGQVIAAGSTWEEDERLLVRYIDEHPDVKLILVPHELNEAHLHLIFNLFRGRFIRLTEATERNIRQTQVLLVDKMGLLSRLYRYATVAYVGGAFKTGLHNTLEPAAHGKAVVFGRHYDHFREAAGLIQAGGGFSVKNYKELERVLDQLLAEPHEAGIKAKEFVLSEQDATEKIIQQLNSQNIQ